MSSVIVRTCRIDSVTPHPNADRLEIAIVAGWQSVVPKGKYAAGSLVTYIPPNCLLPLELSDRLGVTKYLSNRRVRSARLRGETSHGFVIDPVGNEGDNVADVLGIEKYVAPINLSVEDAATPSPDFLNYTDMENMRHFPSVFQEGERVIVTEKIHGTCSRGGLIKDENGVMQQCCGSKSIQRKITENGLYSLPLRTPGIYTLLHQLSDGHGNVQVFGEIYGKVQKLRYGLPQGLGYRLFDVSVNGEYLNYDVVKNLCGRIGLEMVPILYDGPFSLAKIIELSKGKSTIPGADNIREGVVVRPAVERTDPRVGRVLLKYVSDDYLADADEDEGE